MEHALCARTAVVAPYVGAWIETYTLVFMRQPPPVAPYVGAWIETLGVSRDRLSYLRRTLRGCVD